MNYPRTTLHLGTIRQRERDGWTERHRDRGKVTEDREAETEGAVSEEVFCDSVPLECYLGWDSY